MRAVVQRVDGAKVSIGAETVGEISGRGLFVLLGITHDDNEAIADRLAEKIWQLRIFEPSPGEGELSAADLSAPVLVVSQFTLYGDTRKGRRPSWNQAAKRPISEPLVDSFVAALRNRGAKVATGRFGEHMRISLVNDGPVTLIVEVSP